MIWKPRFLQSVRMSAKLASKQGEINNFVTNLEQLLHRQHYLATRLCPVQVSLEATLFGLSLHLPSRLVV